MKDSYMLNRSSLIQSLKTDKDRGLTSHERRVRLIRYGKNTLPEKKSKNFLFRFFSQFANFMILILLIAAGLSLYTSYLAGQTDFIEPGIILAILVLNAFLGAIQESRAENSLRALKKCQSPKATVLCDGKFIVIPAEELVPGDIINLYQGSIVPADARLLDAISLCTNESALTGESLPVAKNASASFSKEVTLSDRKNMIYSSTVITSGHCTALVTETGSDTEIGHIAEMLNTEPLPVTPLMRKMNSLSRVLGISCIIICILIFLIGIFQNMPLTEMFLTSISLAVASIPEGLPAVVTIMLSIGVMRLASQRCITRNLSAAETLGRVTVICSDKTGTLTKNKMTLAGYYVPSSHKAVLIKDSPKKYKNLTGLLKSAYINTSIEGSDGDATEKAIAEAAAEFKILKLQGNERKIFEIPFNSERKYMASFVSDDKETILYIKGAIDRVLPMCADHDFSALNRINGYFTDEAYRVLCVASKKLSADESLIIKQISKSDSFYDSSLKKILSGLSPEGLLAFSDPPRPEVKNSIEQASNAGIRTVMITGDHVKTAISVAKQLGIPCKKAITGIELDQMSDEMLSKHCSDCFIFARVSPHHKVRLVKAYQSLGHYVIMTGDGINDAPALNAADIGAAMGLSGTDVARDAADLVLTDDNYSTIVDAISCGRGIIENIQKSIHFLLSCNTGEILTVLFALIAGLPAPLAAIQLLWINFITDSLPAIAIGMAPSSSDILSGNPLTKEKSFFSGTELFRILLEGSLIASVSLVAYTVYGCTGCFIVLGMSELMHSFDFKSKKSLFKRPPRNLYLTLSFFICSALQLGVVLIPSAAACFSLTPLSFKALVSLILLSSTIILISELEKLLYKDK